MIKDYISINRILRTIVKRSWDAIESHFISDDLFPTITYYIIGDIRELERLWPKEIGNELIDNLKQNAKSDNMRAIIEEDIPRIEDAIDNLFASEPSSEISSTIIDFLNPIIIESSYRQFRRGHFREAVFNSISSVFDLIRKKTNIDKDGVELVGEAFSLQRPKLVISDIQTESGRNEQKGFMQLLQGAFLGIRNPKAHSLRTDLNEIKTAQYLIIASLLARRVDEARIVVEDYSVG